MKTTMIKRRRLQPPMASLTKPIPTRQQIKVIAETTDKDNNNKTIAHSIKPVLPICPPARQASKS